MLLMVAVVKKWFCIDRQNHTDISPSPPATITINQPLTSLRLIDGANFYFFHSVVIGGTHPTVSPPLGWVELRRSPKATRGT